MKVIWLRKQYESEGPMRDAAWQLQSYAVELKRFVKDNPEARAALDKIEEIAIQISQAMNEGDYERVKELAQKAASLRSIVAPAVPDNDAARDYFLTMSDAIRALGGY